MLTVESKLTAEDNASVKAALLLEIKLFKQGELLPYAKDGLAVLEPADSEGCAEVLKTKFLSFVGSLGKVVGKACFAAPAPFLLPFQAGDSLKPTVMVPHFPYDRQLIGLSYKLQGFVTKLRFLLGEDVAVGKE